MGSPITFSGFNQIDFSVVLDAIMQQESAPLVALQDQQTTLNAANTALGQLAGKLDAVRSAAAALSTGTADYAATSSDANAVAVSVATGAMSGRYELTVKDLARAQVTASSTSAPDADATVAATGGILTIGGVDVAIDGPVTLQQLAARINATADVPASASIVETAPGAFRLVLTGRQTGSANAFTVINHLTGATLAFGDDDQNGVSGDTAADNAVQASDAAVTINGIDVVSASNTLQSGIPGVSVTLLQKDAAKTVTVTVARNDQALTDKLKAFVASYNDLVQFANDQSSSATSSATLSVLSVLRSLRATLRGALSDAYGSGAFTRLAEIGLGFTRTGQLALDEKMLGQALATDAGAVTDLVSGASGAFAAANRSILDYTRTGGLVPDARARVSQELTRLGARIDETQARLALRRAALQQEFIAADQAMSRLNSQSGALSSFGTSLSTSTV